MSQAIDHDRLFKELLKVFFTEFLELFAPDAAALVDKNSLEFLDKELFTDIAQGERREVDLAVKGRFRDQDACFLIHVETQATRRADFARRMFRYGAHLYEKHNLPIYPVAVLSYDTPRNEEPDAFVFEFGDWTPLRYTFRVVQLNRLNWRDFVNRPNPVASALMAKMGVAAEERATVKFECLRLLATLKLDPARTRLISGFVDTYLRLTAAEQAEFEEKLAQIEDAPKEAVMQIVTSWMEEGLQHGLQQGLQQGEQAGGAKVVLRLLRRRFGTAVEPEAARIQSLPTTLLERLADDLLDLARAEDVTAWLDAQTSEGQG